MARKKKKEGEEGADAAGGKAKKGNLIPAVIIAVGLILGGKMMGGGSAAPATGVVATTTTLVPGPVIKLDPITLNMSDGRFLRVGLGFQLKNTGAAGGAHAAKPDTTDAAGTYAHALDITIAVLGGKNYAELVSPEGRDAAKKVLVEQLKHAYENEIEDVYFTEFVLQ
jgi:flagellar FliL protein